MVVLLKSRAAIQLFESLKHFLKAQQTLDCWAFAILLWTGIMLFAQRVGL